MNSLKLTLNGVLLGSFLVLGLSFSPADAGQEAYVPEVKKSPLTKSNLVGVENREVIVERYEFPPGFVTARHTHPGPVFVYVIQGELAVDVDGEERQIVKAGELYEEPINRVMQGRNMSTTDPLTIVVFQVNEPGQPTMIKAD